METTQATSSSGGGAADPPGERAAIPVPPPARAAIVEHRRHIAEANAVLQAYLAGLAAGLGLPADRIEGIDVGTWTIRLRGDRPEPGGGHDGYRPGSAEPGG